jgi:hypothetical protein
LPKWSMNSSSTTTSNTAWATSSMTRSKGGIYGKRR